MTTTTQRTGPEPKCASCGHGTLSHNAVGGACTKCDCGHFKPAKNETRRLRPGCGRTLKSAKSVAAGYGPVCARKICEAALTEARTYGLKRECMECRRDYSRNYRARNRTVSKEAQ